MSDVNFSRFNHPYPFFDSPPPYDSLIERRNHSSSSLPAYNDLGFHAENRFPPTGLNTGSSASLPQYEPLAGPARPPSRSLRIKSRLPSLPWKTVDNAVFSVPTIFASIMGYHYFAACSLLTKDDYYPIPCLFRLGTHISNDDLRASDILGGAAKTLFVSTLTVPLSVAAVTTGVVAASKLVAGIANTGIDAINVADQAIRRRFGDEAEEQL